MSENILLIHLLDIISKLIINYGLNFFSNNCYF